MIGSSDKGIEIVKMGGQLANTSCPISSSLVLDSNVTVERDSHPKKQYLPSISTEEGMKIDESDEQKENAEAPIHRSAEPVSKTIFVILLHSEKQ
jgi:hypothetical protein